MGGATEEVEHLMSSASTRSLLDLTQLHDVIIIIAMSPIYKIIIQSNPGLYYFELYWTKMCVKVYI